MIQVTCSNCGQIFTTNATAQPRVRCSTCRRNIAANRCQRAAFDALHCSTHRNAFADDQTVCESMRWPR